MKSPVPLANAQKVVWAHATLAFALAGALPASSVSCTCGTTTWATTLTKADSDKTLYLSLPAAAVGATDEVYCPKGDVVCKAREWSTSASVVAEMTDATCYACDSQGLCTLAES